MSALTLASCGKKNATPPGGTVSSVSISQSSIEVQIGKRSTDVSVTIEGEGDYNKNVKLVSENEAIAKASFTEVETGGTFKVYGIADGSTKINVISLQDESKATSLSVSVKAKEEAPGVSEILSVSLSKETHLFHISDSPLSVTVTLNGRGTFDDTVVVEAPEQGPISVDKAELKSGESFSVTPVSLSNGETSTIKVSSKQDATKYAELVVRVDEDIEPVTPEDDLSLNAKARTLQEGGANFTVTATTSAGDVSWAFKEEDATEYVAFVGTPTGSQATVRPVKATPGDKVATLVATVGSAKAECKFRVTEKQTEYRTYYVSKNAYFADYENIYFYTWDENDNAKVAWPGEKLTKSVKNTLGEDCYEFTVDTLQYIGFLFNDGGDRKTDDTLYAFGSNNNVWYDSEGAHFASLEKDEPTVSFLTNSVTIYNGEDAETFGFNVRKGDAHYEVTSGADKVNVTAFSNGSISIEGVALGTAAIRVYIPGEPGQEDLAEDYLYIEVLDASSVTTFYFSNNKGWESVYVHCWTPKTSGDGNEAETNWPGNQLFNPIKNSGKEDVYVVHVPCKYEYIVLNNGTGEGKEEFVKEQTVDIKLSSVGFDATHDNIYLDGTPTDGKYNYAVAKFEPLTYTVSFASATATVYEDKNTKVGVTTNGEGVTYNVSEGSENVQIFKTSDTYVVLKWLKSGSAKVVASVHGATAELTVTCSDEKAPEGSDKLYFTNNKEWTKVYLYVWGDTGTGKEWPGTQLTSPIKNADNQDVYILDFDTATYDKFIVSNGDGSQTVNISLDNEAFIEYNNIYLLDATDDSGHFEVGFANYHAAHVYDPVTHYCECGKYDPEYMVTIRFEVTYGTGGNGDLFIVGIPNWDTWTPMTWSTGDVWFVELKFVPGTEITFKYVVGWKDMTNTWENDPNREYTVPNTDATYDGGGWHA